MDPKKSSLDTAMGNILDLKRFLDMSEEEFGKQPREVKSAHWWKVSKIGMPGSFGDKNHVKSLDKLTEVYRLSKFFDRTRSGWLNTLIIDGQVRCKLCHSDNTIYGLFACSIDSAKDHLKSPYHKKCVEEFEASLQQHIDDMHGGAGPGGMTLDDRLMLEDSKRSEALLVGSFVAGGRGAAGIPPSSIHELFNKDALNILHHDLKAGFPSASHIISRTLPNAILIVEDRLKAQLKDTPISVYIDGGAASNLALGRKVVVICASSMKWKDNVLLDVLVIETHETSGIQCNQIDKVAKKYGILPKNIQYLCADNASPNKLTVEKLNSLPGYNMQYARCLPHCLNLVIKSFMNVMDVSFKISTHLKLARQFLTAGGGLARKLLAVEFGFTASSIDFVDTRWASLVNAVLYVANLPSDHNNRMAQQRLQELADNGDETAQAALDDRPPPREVFFILFDLFQSVTEQQLAKEKKALLEVNDDVTTADMSLAVARQTLLAYFAQPLHFLAFQVIEYFFGGDAGTQVESIKTVFSITQGDPNFAAKLTSKHTGVVPDCVSATKALIDHLIELHYKWETRQDHVNADYQAEVQKGDSDTLTAKSNVIDARNRFRDMLKSKMGRYCDITIDYYKHINADIYDESKPFDANVAAKWKVDQMQIYSSKTETILLNAVYKAVHAVDAAEGLQKTLECLKGLEISQAFDVNKKPKTFDLDNKILKHIGGSDHKQVSMLLSQWKEYASEWKKPDQVLSPTEVYKYWEDNIADLNVLAPHAMRMFSRPISAAACERVFSFLEGMNKKDRCNMQGETLRKLLFLRGNSKTMRSALRDATAQRIKAELDLDKKKREESMAAFLAKQVITVISDCEDDDIAKVAPTPTSKKKKRKLRREAPQSEDNDSD
jgi:hypothetical protein